jgi:predicted nucleic acid-binding protein
MIVVADTSPINYLVLIGQINLLPELYGRILVPPAVWAELHSPRTPPAVQALMSQTPEWLVMCTLTSEPDPSLSSLDEGEREAIALAEQVNAGRLIVDESLARNAATRRNLETIGTLGVLRRAAILGLISLPEALSRIQQTSFFAAPALIQSLLEEDAKRVRSVK